MSGESFVPDDEFLEGVYKIVDYYKKIFTEEERTEWDDPKKCVSDINDLATGKLLDREIEALSDNEDP